MVDMLRVPAANCEPLRFVRYHEGDFFGRHHDAAGQEFAPHTPGGPRIWTLYVFLRAPARGGAFAFPALNLTVAPKPGRAILWPHLLDSDLATPDARTEHEGGETRSADGDMGRSRALPLVDGRESAMPGGGRSIPHAL